MNKEIEQMQAARLDWEPTPECAFLFRSLFRNKQVQLRLNDFPDEPLCTVIVGGVETDLEDFPKTWTLPKHRERGAIQNPDISVAG
ncbi:MAG TPA: hypothetical protein PK671_26385 [Candidatus Obscuribacter sp.]|nr:hypothetical protein [Candidatus Obscuribacter sp.]HNH75861.1 hypothetical protein [Candidatus Obscuribacter sp.]